MVCSSLRLSAWNEDMIKLAAHRLTTIGILLSLFGLASKTMELAVPEWIACVSISAGLIVIIFVCGSHSSGSTRRHDDPTAGVKRFQTKWPG
jgi:hypothetical protein